MGAQLPVGDGVDLHGLHGLVLPVEDVEVYLPAVGLHLQVPGIYQVVRFQAALPCDLGSHFFQ